MGGMLATGSQLLYCGERPVQTYQMVKDVITCTRVPTGGPEMYILRYQDWMNLAASMQPLYYPWPLANPSLKAYYGRKTRLCRSSKPRTTGIPGASGTAYGPTIHSVNSRAVAMPQYAPHPLEVYAYMYTAQRDAFFVAGGANEGFDVPVWMECNYSTSKLLLQWNPSDIS